MRKIVIATRNGKKLKEVKDIMNDIDLFDVVDLGAYPEAGEIEETGSSFRENAIIKATAVAALTGNIAVADDSGLCVDALDGAPGIYSARFAGEQADDNENNKKLLEMLKGVPRQQRTARFVCNMAVVYSEKLLGVGEGVIEGYISDAPCGDNGFGYDPLFFVPEYDRTMAQLPSDIKNKISHRFQALIQMKKLLFEYLGEIEKPVL